MANNNLDLNELANRADHQLSITVNSDDPLKRESDIRLKEADQTLAHQGTAFARPDQRYSSDCRAPLRLARHPEKPFF